MTISASSRYAQSTILTLDVNGNSRQVIYPQAGSTFTFTYVTHVYSDDETLDGIADNYYGDPTQWWKIGQANPEIMDWSTLQPGTTLRIPAG
jgi:nucleoid-associated protein YgaU